MSLLSLQTVTKIFGGLTAVTPRPAPSDFWAAWWDAW